MTRSHPDNIQPMFTPDAAGVERLALGVLDMPDSTDSGQMIDPNPGPSVDIRERSEELQNALVVLGRMSRNTGYRTGAEIAPIRRKFERRGDPVELIAGRMTDAHPRLRNEAKLHFGRAFGAAAMNGAGFMSMHEAEQAKSTSFEDFVGKYADKKNREPRDAFKAKLKKQVRILDRPAKKR